MIGSKGLLEENVQKEDSLTKSKDWGHTEWSKSIAVDRIQKVKPRTGVVLRIE